MAAVRVHGVPAVQQGLPIVQAGWHNWDKPDADLTTYCGEFGSVGAGASSEERVAWSHRLSGDGGAKDLIETILGS
ncbi:pectinesterase family protein [Stenotrophomonas indicatrix]|uniref:pectinesterase family protein n=1 Tax=Stenotrophomonas indicatrix TaxID=2045451 RepID=UPI0007397516|nr:pectinesterase family protein [Stenotrophomonas indicatrix]CRD57249.1 hypothetical protein BN1263520058 [Stenotrophomonas indicatrix]